MTDDEVIEFERLKTARDSLLLKVANLRGQLETIAASVSAEKDKEIGSLRALCEEMLSELYVYRASEHLKDVTAAIKARGQK